MTCTDLVWTLHHRHPTYSGQEFTVLWPQYFHTRAAIGWWLSCSDSTLPSGFRQTGESEQAALAKQNSYGRGGVRVIVSLHCKFSPGERIAHMSFQFPWLSSQVNCTANLSPGEEILHVSFRLPGGLPRLRCLSDRWDSLDRIQRLVYAARSVTRYTGIGTANVSQVLSFSTFYMWRSVHVAPTDGDPRLVLGHGRWMTMRSPGGLGWLKDEGCTANLARERATFTWRSSFSALRRDVERIPSRPSQGMIQAWNSAYYLASVQGLWSWFTKKKRWC